MWDPLLLNRLAPQRLLRPSTRLKRLMDPPLLLYLHRISSRPSYSSTGLKELVSEPDLRLKRGMSMVPCTGRELKRSK